MRRRLGIVLTTWLVSATWLGCNLILGNESAVFAPEAPEAGPDVLPPNDGAPNVDDGSSPRDGDVVDVDAGPCVDTATNPKHCGACFHDCLGGQCAGGVCQPVSVATDDGVLLAIALDATHVYWANRTTGDIMRAPLGGGPAERVFDGPSGLDPGKEFAVYGGHVYFAFNDPEDSSGFVMRCPVTGCAGAPQPVVSGLTSVDFVAVQDGGTLLFTELSGRVARCTLPCTPPFETIASGESFPLRATAAGDAVVWSTLDPGRGGVVRAKVGTAPPFDVKTSATPYAVAIAGEEIIWAQLGSGPRAIRRDGGGPVRLLTSSGTQTSYMVVENGSVYFTDSRESIGAVYRCALSGCVDGGLPLAANQAKPNGIAVDTKSVYWTTEGSPGVIWRIAK